MGINGLWDVTGRGEVVSIAKYATDHFNQHGRPLRVAVDEPGWRFNNLTPQQVEMIRKKEPAANPIEKTVIWRIFLLMKLNIQPIWILDGPRRPWKRNKRGGGGGPQVEYERTKLLIQLLDHLKVPHHRAPAEAEAECARLQRLGIVDAVWSDDGDTLMFGATCLIGAHRVESKWSPDKITVLRAENILKDHDFDSESLVLFAMLAGADYNTSGLIGCGPQIARLVSRKSHGLANELCHASQQDISAWRHRLEETLGKEGRRMQVPVTFPDMKALGHYCNPVVSTDAQLRELRGLRNGWDAKIDQNKLRVLLRNRFNIWTRGYMKHIAPIFMVRQLARCSRDDVNLMANTKYDIQLKRTIKRKSTNGDDSEEPTDLERKITFYPLPAVEIDLQEPEGEDWSIWESKDGSHFDPAGRVECNILDCFLKHGLPEGHLTTAEPAKRQKKQKATVAASDSAGASASASVPSIDAEATTAASAPKKRARPKKSVNAAADDVEAMLSEGVPQVPQKRGRPKKDANTTSTTQSNKRKKPSKDDAIPTPPPPVFRLPRGSSFTSSAASSQKSRQDPILLEDDDEPTASTSQALRTSQTMPTFNKATSFATTESRSPIPPSTPLTPTALVPGEATSPATIRALRAATWSFQAATPPLEAAVAATKTTPPMARPTVASHNTARVAPSRVIPAGAEIIDLSD
jgi:Holliday junction resolvase YEN1